MKEMIGNKVVSMKQRSDGTYLIIVKEKAGDWPLEWEIDEDGYRMCRCMWNAAYEDALATFNAAVQVEKI